MSPMWRLVAYHLELKPLAVVHFLCITELAVSLTSGDIAPVLR